jgi:hypothetical protein
MGHAFGRLGIFGFRWRLAWEHGGHYTLLGVDPTEVGIQTEGRRRGLYGGKAGAYMSTLAPAMDLANGMWIHPHELLFLTVVGKGW